jgi:hypothetical protein
VCVFSSKSRIRNSNPEKKTGLKKLLPVSCPIHFLKSFCKKNGSLKSGLEKYGSVG